MTFDELNLQLFTRHGKGAGLVGFSALLARLANPQKKIKIVHVAGTNGKGSVCTLLARVLTCSGERTGLFVSPHLVSPTERISVDGQEISQNDFVCCVQAVLVQEREKLNFFEILTAAALIYFAEKKCEYVVLETGLGGRKDPTNVCNPLACVITSIGLDHTQILGSTLTQIATDKAGIIKPGVPVFCGLLVQEAHEVIRQVAAAQKSPVYFVREGEPFPLASVDVARGNLLLSKEKDIYPLHLLGRFQTLNACIVWKLARFLGVPGNVILQAFKTVQIPGRFEIFRRGENTLVLDGAHNPQAVAALAEFWCQTPYSANAALVCGFMKDKDYQQMLELLAPHFQRIIVTLPPSSRAAGKEELSRFLTRPGITFEPDLQAALSQACGAAQNVLCTGSFYLVGAVRKMCVKQKEKIPS